jgi:uncharacterized protein
MANFLIQDLLKVHTFDIKLINLKRSLAHIPEEIAMLSGKIEEIETWIKQLQEKLKNLELERKQTHTQFQATEDKISKYKNQQLSVKKNEEYKALEDEITIQRNGISELEDKELELLLQIDKERKTAKEKEAGWEQQIERFKKRIADLRGTETDYRKKVDHAAADYNQSLKTIDIKVIRVYESVKVSVNSLPYICQLEDHKCNGCHLRVSNQVFEETKIGTELVRCENCSRIIYSETNSFN